VDAWQPLSVGELGGFAFVTFESDCASVIRVWCAEFDAAEICCACATEGR